MNYQHAFHAGNFADVHKHVVLARILEYLRQKESAFRVIDTHAGCGRYDLFGPEAERAQEWRGGIGRLFKELRTNTYQQKAVQKDSAQTLLAPYLDAVAAVNAAGDLRVYPGSPLIALSLMRRQDRLIACELELRAATLLKAALEGEPRAKVLTIDGWMALNANVPPRERRGIVLVDPPYEESDDFSRLSAGLAEAYRKWPTGIYVLWYPIKDRDAPDALARRLRKLAVPKILRCEIMLGTPRADAGLIGSGLIVVNPPYPLASEMKIILPALARLSLGNAEHRLDWLAPEMPARTAKH
ncbi:MAG TPA: 23S rRNA (adenine(2030)-N(6))-methyltransferase RlmJ [Xanthobacteraceae bacterium]|jgi:23S rRNA (adenine2030-N6)-methyltransferase|nr:23S rRNA (adenine(2030)-N(6))-methyltransferase RlmJ [Xanthobacteraceae bacterium]